MMRKALCLALATALAVSTLTACGKGGSTDTGIVEPITSATTEATTSVNTDKSETTMTQPAEIPSEEVKPEETQTTETKAEATVNSDVNYLAYYAKVLSRVHYAITKPERALEDRDGEAWLFEISNYGNGSTNLRDYGYCLKDISGDGIPELMFTNSTGDIVYNLYTLVDNEPYLVCDGYYRSRYAYAGGRTFVYFGSAGAMYQMLGRYELSEDGRELIPVNYYFTSEGSSVEEMVSYFNTTGEDDKANSELIENDAFFSEWNEYESNIVTLDYVPFAENSIGVAFLKDNPGLTVVGNYTTDVTEYAQSIIVFDGNGMSDIEILGLEYLDYSDRGNISFGITYIYNMDSVKPGEAIQLNIGFGEAVPIMGLQCKDSNGVLRQYAFDISGEDGSVYMWEF